MNVELRPRGPEEAAIYFHRSNDPQICEMFPRTVTTLEQAMENYRVSLLPGASSYGRTIYADGQYVGDVWCYCMEPRGTPEAMVSFCLFEKTCWGQGIATRALEMFLDRVRETFGLTVIGAFCYRDNAPSLSVLMKNGFSCVETFRDGGRASCYLERYI